MSGYLLSIIGTVLLCAILVAIVPQGKTSSVIKGIAKLSCVLVIVSPVLRFFKTGEISENSTEKAPTFFLQNGIRADETFIQYHSETRVSQTETALEKEIFEKYGTETEVCLFWQTDKETVGKYYETERIKIDNIRVKCMTKTTEERKKAMWEYLTQNYCSEVLIE